MLTPAEITRTNHRESTIKKHYPEFYTYLYTKYPDIPWMQKCYLYYHGVDNPPVCPICGRYVPFKNIFEGYRKYCSVQCGSQGSVDKRKATNLKKYGATSPLASESNLRKSIESVIKAKYGAMGNAAHAIKQKTKNTCLLKYGATTPFESGLIQSKAQETTTARYGGLGNASEKIFSKAKQTMMGRYGVDNYSKSVEYKQLHEHKSIRNHPDIIAVESNMYICKCPHSGCSGCQDKTYAIPKGIYANRKIQQAEPCTRLLPIEKDRCMNTSIELFVQNILNNYKIDYISNDRNVIAPKIADIYLPDYKLIIEVNGIYWHSDKCKSKKSHMDRLKYVNSLGYQMITIWEDWIVNTPDIVKSILLSKLGIFEHRIYARQCDIRPINSKQYLGFLKYHIQGRCQSSIKYGLFYNDNLIAVMGFGKKRKSMMGSKQQDESYELMRYCCMPGYQIIGGASKLLNRFIKDYNPLKIISFSSNDISDGKLYDKLGFTKQNINPSYWYIDKNYQRYHRYKYNKQALIKMGADPTKTEFEITDSMGLYRIWDTGQVRWEIILH